MRTRPNLPRPAWVLPLLILFLFPALVRAEEKGASKDKSSIENTLKRVKKRLKAAEIEIDYTLKKHRAEKKTPEAQSSVDLSRIEERLESIEDDIDALVGVQDKLVDQVKEDKLRWSGALRTTVNNFHVVDDTVDSITTHLELVLDDFGQPIYDPETGAPLVRPVSTEQPRNSDRWFGHNWVNRLHLTMTYDITENLRFYGRLVVFKYMNELSDEVEVLDMHSTRYPRDVVVRLERAFFDWFITDWLALSAGRIAAPEGPPVELRENTVRSATWGVQMVESSMDAILLTFHLSKFLEGTYLRLFYSPWTTHTDPFSSDDTSLFDNLGLADMHVVGGMFELKIPHLGDNLWQIGIAGIPSFRPRNVPVWVSQIGDYVDPSEPTGQDLGGYMMSNILVELKDIAGSGLDFFAAYSLTVLMPTDDRMVFEIPVELPIHHPVTGPTGSTFTGTSRYEVGLASYEEGSGTTNLGHFVFAGFRWTFPWWESYVTRIGAEFNYGSKYHIAWSSPSDLLVNRLATKGWTWEVYVIQELVEEHLFARVGFVQLDRNYEGSYIGPTTKIDQTIQNTYFLMDAHW